MRVLALLNRHSTARGLRNDFQLAAVVRVSNQTARNRLHGDALQARRPATGPILQEGERRDRRIFAQDHIGWQLNQWRTVLFTDESRFKHVLGVYGVAIDSGTWNVTLLNIRDSVMAQSCSGEGIVMTDVQSGHHEPHLNLYCLLSSI